MNTEPVMIGQAISAVATILAAVFHLTTEQVAAIGVVGQLIAGLIARAKVTPTAKL